MTKEKAIEILEQRGHCAECVADCTCDECKEAFDMAIKALEALDGDCSNCLWYQEVQKTLDESEEEE